MRNETLVNISENTDKGKVEIATDVNEVITGIAKSKFEVLVAMRGNFASGVVERFGGVSHTKGVKEDLTDEGILIDLHVVLKFGVSIPEVAQKLQSNIRQSLKNMTGLEITEINIHVVGIQMDQDEENE